MVLEYMHQEGIKEVMIGNIFIMLLLYVDDVLILAHTLEYAQKLMVVLVENFCSHSALMVNNVKTKVMLVKKPSSRRNHVLCIIKSHLK